MKKRIVATLLVGAIAATGIIGLSACGGVSVPKGEQVSKEVWEKAFTSEKIEELTNYTYEASATGNSTVKGTIKYNDETSTVSATIKMSDNTTLLYDKDGNKAYSETSRSSNVKSDGNDGKDTVKTTSSSKETGKLYYELKEENTYWRAEYSSSESKSTNSESGKDSESSERKWYAHDTLSFAYSNIRPSLFNDEYFDNADPEKAENSGKVSELYDLFEYSNGVYTATLYKDLEIYNDMDLSDVVECKVTVSIKDGYVVGYSVKADAKGTLSYKSDSSYYKMEYNFDYTIKATEVIAITKIKSTDVSKKANKDIKNAIQKAKDQENN